VLYVSAFIRSKKTILLRKSSGNLNGLVLFSVCYWTWKSSLDNDGELEHRMVDLLNSSLPLEYQNDDEEDPGLETRFDDDNEEHLAMMSMEEFDSTEEDETKVNRRKQPHSLLVFGMTRWYSAWTVMKRFYELYDACVYSRKNVKCIQIKVIKIMLNA